MTRIILAWLVRVIPGQTMIKLLMVLALNPQSSRQKENDLRAKPMWDLQKGIWRLWQSPPIPQAIGAHCPRVPHAWVMPWEKGLRSQWDLSPSPCAVTYWWFPRVSIMKYPKLGGLEEQTFILSHFWSPEGQNEGVTMAPLPPKALRRNPPLPLPVSSVINTLAFLALQVMNSIFSLHLHMAVLSPRPNFPLLTGTSVIGLGPTQIQYDLILT